MATTLSERLQEPGGSPTRCSTGCGDGERLSSSCTTIPTPTPRLGTCVAPSLCDEAEQGVGVTFSGIIGRSENIAMAPRAADPLTPLGMVTWPTTTSSACRHPAGHRQQCGSADAKVDLVIDHHPCATGAPVSLGGCAGKYGVTATILYEYLIAQQVPISTKIATALFYAIKSETQDLGREANEYDRGLSPSLPADQQALLFQITIPGSRSTTTEPSSVPSQCGHLRFPSGGQPGTGHFPGNGCRDGRLPHPPGADRDRAQHGHYCGGIVFSLRTNSHDLNAGEISRRLVQGLGAAGGHGMMAGGKIESVPPDDESIARIVKTLTERLLAECDAEGTSPRSLTDR